MAEEKRLAEEKKLAEEKAAEERRLAAEKQAQENAERARRQEQQKIDEKNAFWEWNAKIQNAILAVDDDWEQLWQNTINDLANGYISPQEAFQNLRELENRLIEDEMKFDSATIPDSISSKYRSSMQNVKDNFMNWARYRRKASENLHLAIGVNGVTPQTLQKSVDLINQADSFMMKASMILVNLENQIGE